MKREVITTKDGSTTIHIIDWNESYHSRHGAIQEANHVFIQNGLNLFSGAVSILEIGFGTGLNALVTFCETRRRELNVDYTGVEAYPISLDEVSAMNFTEQPDLNEHSREFELMHSCEWNKEIKITSDFTLTKRQQFFQEIDDVNKFDLIYFDAFGYDVQPELWSTEIFARMFESLKESGILVTYAARGVVKRSMIEVGFTVEKLPGPPGKREMFRATKSAS